MPRKKLEGFAREEMSDGLRKGRGGGLKAGKRRVTKV